MSVLWAIVIAEVICRWAPIFFFFFDIFQENLQIALMLVFCYLFKCNYMYVNVKLIYVGLGQFDALSYLMEFEYSALLLCYRQN